MENKNNMNQPQGNGPRPVERIAVEKLNAVMKEMAAPLQETPVDHTELLKQILAKIDTVVNDAYIREALQGFNSWECEETAAEAINNVVFQREETNRQALTLLKEMYQDLKPPVTKPMNLTDILSKEQIQDMMQMHLQQYPGSFEELFLKRILG